MTQRVDNEQKAREAFAKLFEKKPEPPRQEPPKEQPQRRVFRVSR